MPPKLASSQIKKQQNKKEEINLNSKRDKSPSKLSENNQETKEEVPKSPRSPKSPKESKISQQDSGEDEGSGEIKRNKKQAQLFKKYLDQTGIAMAFQVIFAEILDKKITENKLFEYTAMRLRQIGEDLQKIKINKK